MKSSAYDVSVNSHGLRGVNIDLSKPAGVKRIAVLGGSSVFGYLVPDGQDSCCQLQRMLAADGFSVEVLNAGVPGFNMTQCRQRYEHLVAAFDPDIVILYLGWNDTRFLIAADPSEMLKTPPAPAWTKRALAHSVLYGFLCYRLFPAAAPQFAPPASKSTKVTELGTKSFQSDLRSLIHSIRQSGALPVISTQIMASNQNCIGLDDYLGSEKTQISTNREIGEWITDQLRLTADQEQIPLLDCAFELPCNKKILGDAIHLTAEGHRVVAELWAKKMRLLLNDSVASSGSTDNQQQ